jgi:hypothetical protein
VDIANRATKVQHFIHFTTNFSVKLYYYRAICAFVGIKKPKQPLKCLFFAYRM